MKYLLLNHKMNFLGHELNSYIENIPKEENIIIFPSFIYIPYFLNKGIKVGSQDVSNKDLGSLTSEVSAPQLKSLGVNYSIIGHSERRKKYQEENNLIKDKILMCQKEGLHVVLCIGDETKEKRFEEISKELTESLETIENFKNIWIAYEPISAIGTGVAISNEEIDEAVTFIKSWIETKYQETPVVLYGGSVNDENISELNKSKADGFLIGNASLNVEKIKRIVGVVNNVNNTNLE